MSMPGKRKLLKDTRQSLGCKNRLRRLQYLRDMKSPSWVIKLEQVKLACNRKGLRGNDNRYYTSLFLRHVEPILKLNEALD